MFAEEPFTHFLSRVRARDEQAAPELVRHYEPTLHRLVRVRLRGRCLWRAEDICQSVLGAFFDRVTRGQYEWLRTAEDLQRLLAVMVRNQTITELRRSRVRVQNVREEANGRALEELVSPDALPNQLLEARDFLEKCRQHLSSEERWLADQRCLDRPWAEIAGDCGDSPDALRKRLRRAFDRVALELRLAGEDSQQQGRQRE